MRQVPAKTYLIIGNGRSARHMAFYLSHLGHQLIHWHYRINTKEQLLDWSVQSDHVLLLIKDSAIESILNQFSFIRSEKTMHLSGALKAEGIRNVHPLISFSLELRSPEFYYQIPFAIFGAPESTIQDFFPGMPNPCFHLEEQHKALYHGLCVASGNFTVLLWQLVAQQFQEHLHVPHEMLLPYLDSVTINLQKNWIHALTGPIARRDEETLLKNYRALSGTPLQRLFESHVELAWPEFANLHFMTT
jgi:hypothetical protein